MVEHIDAPSDAGGSSTNTTPSPEAGRHHPGVEHPSADVRREAADVQGRAGRLFTDPTERVVAVEHIPVEPGGAPGLEREAATGTASSVAAFARPADVDDHGPGDAELWPPASDALVVLTDRRLLVMRGGDRYLDRHDVLAAWWLDRLAGFSHHQGATGATLEVRFADGSTVDVPVTAGGPARHFPALWEEVSTTLSAGSSGDPTH